MGGEYEQERGELGCIKRKAKDDRVWGIEFFHHPHSKILVSPPGMWENGSQLIVQQFISLEIFCKDWTEQKFWIVSERVCMSFWN